MSQMQTYDGFKDLSTGSFFLVQFDPIQNEEYPAYVTGRGHMQWLCRKDTEQTYKLICTSVYEDDKPELLLVASRSLREYPDSPIQMKTVGEEQAIPLLQGMRVVTDKERVREAAVTMTQELARKHPEPEHRDAYIKWMFTVGDSMQVIPDPEARTSLAVELAVVYEKGMTFAEKENTTEREPLRG